MGSAELCIPGHMPSPAHSAVLGGESTTRSFDLYEEPYQHGKQPAFSGVEPRHDYGASTLPTPPQSPEPSLSFTTEDGAVAEIIRRCHEEGEESKSQLRLDIGSLRSDLLLGDEMCGARTQKGTRCKNRISKANYEKISASLSELEQQAMSAEALVERLRALVQLVHCHNHDPPGPTDSRLDVWIPFIPREPQSPKPRFLIARDIARALSMSTKCIGINSEGECCKALIGGQKVHNCARTIKELIKPEVYINQSFVATYLKVLEANRYCRYHPKQHRPDLKKQWKLAIARAHERPLSDEQLSTHSNDTDDKKLFTSRSCTNKFGASIDAAAFWPEDREISPWIILGNARGHEPQQSPDRLIQTTAFRLLDCDDRKPGQVYIYQVEGNPGLLKIGYTTRPLRTRHKEWEEDCNRDVLPLYPVHIQDEEVLTNARRIEALCHAELADCRVRVYCANCMKEHTEWFEVSEDRAISVVRRWSSWMKTEPYGGNRLKLEEKRMFATRTMQRAVPAAIRT